MGRGNESRRGGIGATAGTADTAPSHFIRNIVAEDLKQGKNQGRVHTRFPPEPNGYLAYRPRQIDLSQFRLGRRVRRHCAIFALTTPIRAKKTSSTSIRSKKTCAGSGLIGTIGNFTPRIISSSSIEFALQLIKAGKAFVCDLNADQMREYRGTLTEPGKNSPYRDRSVEENLDLFQRMRAGEFADGSRTLRAKIDMASPNINLRDPVMYRVLARDPSSHRRQVVHLSDL